MLASLVLKFKEDIVTQTDKGKEIIDIESYRDCILSFCNNEPQSILDIVNNKKHSYPKIIYSKPQGNTIRIFSIGEEGRVALNTIFANVVKKSYVKITGKKYALKGIPKIEFDLEYLPYINGNINTYTTLTPINVFNKKNIVVFQAILSKYLEKGKNFNEHSEDIKQKVYNELSNFSTNVIKDNIKYMLSEILPDKQKDNFKFVDSIEINWEDFGYFYSYYHSEEKPLPMIRGRFTSNFVLPKFVGYKIGKGFGELSHKKGSI